MKTRKVQVSRYGAESVDQMHWCRQTLGPAVKGGNWWYHRGYLYFKEPKYYLLYQLRWS